MQAEVGAWLQRRTTSGQDWDREELARAKTDTTISVVLPARNEAGTVGLIVDELRRELIERVPLIDELVVMDSGSVDETAVVAAEAGARVVRQSDVLAPLVDRPGKGEALWKSLYVTRGDVVVFIDADLEQFDPQFAVGLMGPLLADPTVEFVKAFYDRPLQAGQTILPAGGGRVTELMARPLLNLHWPQLAGFVQPLSGEYAARRTLLEQLPFPTGYGVEIGILVDALRLVGLDGLAQVDLSRRKHRNQEIGKLGRMSSEILQVVLERLRREGRLALDAPPATELVQFERSEDDYLIHCVDMAPAERPPVLTVPEYRARTAR
jgi:glucosyl-3-phosphoglycerate synthase